jgi:hypothetical protein
VLTLHWIHVHSIIWVFCECLRVFLSLQYSLFVCGTGFLSHQALVKSVARLYHQTTAQSCPMAITMGEVRELLLDTMSNDPKRKRTDPGTMRHIQGLYDYHDAVSFLSPVYK